MAKIRVYELAAELGIDSKRLLGYLREQGEFVRSASSTIEPPVVRRIREQYPQEGGRRPTPQTPTPPQRRPDNNPFKPVAQRARDQLAYFNGGYNPQGAPRPRPASGPRHNRRPSRHWRAARAEAPSRAASQASRSCASSAGRPRRRSRDIRCSP